MLIKRGLCLRCLKRLLQNKKGQSITEFLLMIPIFVWVIIICFQIFYIIYTSLVNQSAARYLLVQGIENNRGYSDFSRYGYPYTAIFPQLDAFSINFRAKRDVSSGQVMQTGNGLVGKVYYQAEEPHGSFPPFRELKTLNLNKIKIKNKVGIYEF